MQAICYESQEAGEEGQQGDMPFSVAETKNSSRGGWCRLRLSNEDAYDILFNVRQEMEVSMCVTTHLQPNGNNDRE